jgi:hypothetical protein
VTCGPNWLKWAVGKFGLYLTKHYELNLNHFYKIQIVLKLFCKNVKLEFDHAFIEIRSRNDFFDDYIFLNSVLSLALAEGSHPRSLIRFFNVSKVWVSIESFR